MLIRDQERANLPVVLVNYVVSTHGGRLTIHGNLSVLVISEEPLQDCNFFNFKKALGPLCKTTSYRSWE